MTTSLSALQGRVDTAARAGNLGETLPELDSAIAAYPARADVRMLRAMVLLSLKRHTDALGDLDRILELDPVADAARFQRALTLFGQERLDQALDDFLQLTCRRPETVEPWANAGVILLRMDRFLEAVPLLRQATQLAPGHAGLRRSLANALVGAGVVDEAIGLYESVLRATPSDPATLTDYAMALLGIGRPQAAHGHLQAALKLDPCDQTALAGLYLSANELGMHAIVDELVDYRRLLWYGTPWQAAALDRPALRDAVLAHPGLVWQPSGRATHQGHQSPMLDLTPGSPFARFGDLVRQLVGERLDALRSDPTLKTRPWVGTLPDRWRLQAWCTVLSGGGRQTPHIHPSGRLSGVYYLDTGTDVEVDAGALVFGQPPRGIATTVPARVHSVVPKDDHACCFPSYFFHHTEPFSGTRGPRISLAFDVLPDA
jgi:tetratricopeptide (TPR) repeat protein